MDMLMTRKVLLDLIEQLTGGTGGMVSVYKRGQPEPVVERMRQAQITLPNDDVHIFVDGLRELMRITERYT